ALELDWRQSSPSFATGVRLEASNDLKTWSVVSSQAPLVRVQRDGQHLEQRSVDFQPRAAKYLRLSWPSANGSAGDAAELLELTHAAVRLGDVTLEPEYSWKDVLPENGEKSGEYVYDLGGRFPVERIRFVLPQANTISRVEVLSRADPRQSWRPVTAG